jgi:uncharacterized protein (DUF2235 family)
MKFLGGSALKRLVFCFDGTWNRLAADCPTNVVLVAEMTKPIASDSSPQIVYYDEGIGTAKDERFRGGAFGKGMMDNIREAYRFLLFNYEPGDHIFAFGFSRGAFTARSFLGFIRHAGILDVDSAKEIDRAIELYRAVFKGDGDDAATALKFRSNFSSQVCVSEWDHDWRKENCEGFDANTQILEIKYLGVWDTVAALGCPKLIPGATWINRKFGYHDAKLTSKVQSARHAVAIDERRVMFEPVLWNNVAELNNSKKASMYDVKAPYQQKWFPGVHGSVGGGGPERGLSDEALAWVLKGARAAGLELRNHPKSRVFEIAPNHLAALQNDSNLPWHDQGIAGQVKRLLLYSDRVGPNDIVEISASARRRWNAPADELPENTLYRPKTISALADRLFESLFGDGFDEAESGQYHLVERGETLGTIAKKYLGNGKRYGEIFDENRHQLDDPDDIYVGMQLRIPASKPSTAV